MYSRRARRSIAARMLSPEPDELLDRVCGLLAGPRVALLHERHDHLLEEAGLALGRGAVHAQVASLDAVLHELRGDLRDLEGVVVVVRVSSQRAAGDEAVATRARAAARR